MAAPQCMSGDGQPAVFVGTMLQTGDAFTLCDSCLVSWCTALLAAATGIDPTVLIEAQSTATDAGGDGEQPATAEPVGETDPPIGRTRDGFPVGRSHGRSGGREGRTGGHTVEAE